MKLIIDLNNRDDIEKGMIYLQAYHDALASTEEPTPKAPAKRKKAAPKAAPVETEANAPAKLPDVTIEVSGPPTEADLRAALTAYGKREKVKPREFLRERYGVERLSDLPLDQWADCMGAVK